MTIYKKFTSKKVLVATILGIGILLSTIFIVSPLISAIAQQQQQQQFTTNDINGSVNDISNYLKESAKIPFTATETAQQQITNGTVLGGHLGATPPSTLVP